jgi:preprotein translocase subunit SecG
VKRRPEFAGGVLRWILTIAIILISVALTVIILMQEGKSQGLGAIAGTSDTYWGKNKGRSMEGFLVKFTTGLVVAFFVIAILLNMNMF